MASENRERTTSPWLVLLVLCLGFFMIMLDTTIVSIAIPAMLKGLSASLDQILWVFNAYLLAYAVLLITAGRLGDIWGPRNLYLAGLLIFTVSSAACGLAQNGDQLIAARVVQGVGAALLTPQTLTLISVIFPAERRGAALGVWSGVVGLATVAGPTLGGLLIRYADWRWIFYLNVPIGVVALAGTLLVVPDHRPGRSHRLDLFGMALASLGLFLVVFALVEGQRYDWGVIGSSLTIPEVLAGGVAVLAGFVLWELKPDEPLLPLSLFRDRNYSVMTWIQGLTAFGMLGFFLPVVILLQSVLGMDAFTAGLTLAPMSIAAMVAAPAAGRLADRVGGKYVVMAGLCVYASGLALTISAISATATQLSFLAPTIVCGLGLGLTLAPLVAEAMRRIPPEQSGAASGLLNTSRQLGGLIGTAATGAVLQNRLAAALSDRARALAAGLQVPKPVRERFIEAFAVAAHNGFRVAPGQFGGAGLPAGVPAPLAPLLRQAAHDVFVQAFVTAARPSLLVPLGVVALGALSCLVAVRDRSAHTRSTQLPDKVEWLQRASLFAGRPERELELCAQNLDLGIYRSGERLMREGRLPNSFHLIIKGQVELIRAGHRIGLLGPGECTEYEAMRNRTPARYTVRALTDVQVLVAGRAQFGALVPPEQNGPIPSPASTPWRGEAELTA